jgi:hypothetical protein
MISRYIVQIIRQNKYAVSSKRYLTSEILFHFIIQVSQKKRRVHSSLIYRRILIIFTPN